MPARTINPLSKPDRRRRSRIIAGERDRNIIRAWRRAFGCNPPRSHLSERLSPDSCFYRGSSSTSPTDVVDIFIGGAR